MIITWSRLRCWANKPKNMEDCAWCRRRHRADAIEEGADR